jgi:hypothetical protein
LEYAISRAIDGHIQAGAAGIPRAYYDLWEWTVVRLWDPNVVD